MFSSLFFICTLFSFGTDFVLTKSANQPFEQTMSTLKLNIPARESMPIMDPGEYDPDMNALWSYRPASVQSRHPGEFMGRKLSFKVPHTITKLVNSLASGYDPHLDKEYFEPLRKRQRPMALVSFRKSGNMAKVETETATIDNNNVAELQSPYNEISSFWEDEPGMRIF